MKSINQFWNNQSSSLNRESNDVFYKKKASEHRSVLDDADSIDGILDLGCGAGELLYYLSKLARIDIGIDFSESMIKAAQERLNGQFAGYLLQSDIFTFLPSAKQPVWTTTGAINQYLNAEELATVLDIFMSNNNVRSFYLFDCIDPLRYFLLLHSISYRVEHYSQINLFLASKNFLRRISIGLLFALNHYSRDSLYLGSPSMGYGQRPSFWLTNCSLRGLHVEIISSRYYEYRYHVVIKKII